MSHEIFLLKICTNTAMGIRKTPTFQNCFQECLGFFFAAAPHTAANNKAHPMKLCSNISHEMLYLIRVLNHVDSFLNIFLKAVQIWSRSKLQQQRWHSRIMYQKVVDSFPISRGPYLGGRSMIDGRHKPPDESLASYHHRVAKIHTITRNRGKLSAQIWT